MKFTSVKYQPIRYNAGKTIQINGGMNTRATPLIVGASEKGRWQSPNMVNCDLFKNGGVSKRLGKTKQGATIAASATISQTTINSNLTCLAFESTNFKIPFVVGSTFYANSLKLNLGCVGHAITCFGLIINSSNSVVATATNSFNLVPGTQQDYIFNFPVTILAPGNYSIIINTYFYNIGDGIIFGINNASGNFYRTVGFTTIAETYTGTPYYVLSQSVSSSTVQGLYDFRYAETSGNYNQAILAAVGGILFLYDGSSTWTSIKTGLASGQNYLYDFCTTKNLCLVTDYGQNGVSVWDGSTSGGNYPVMALGYRATFSAAEASSGSIAAGVYKLLAVTQMKSGGYRASAEATVTVTGGSKKIAVTSVAMNSSTTGEQFGFDIDTTATIWWMTDAAGSIYYKIPTADMSVTNPAANSTTAFDITSTANLTTSSTMLTHYGLDQSYFTNQVATPKAKFIKAWSNFVVMAGDPANQSTLWVSELGAPQIWAEGEGTLGYRVDVATDDGQIIRGLAVYNGFLFVFKNRSIYRIEYTGNAALPFIVNRLVGNIGTLSHWTIREIPTGLVFLSEGGPAICYGNSSTLLGGQIANLFDQNDANRFNLSAMTYSTSAINSLKKQIWFGVSTVSATTRDQVLVYDWELDAWWINDGCQGNYFATITDTAGFEQFWSGDYSGQVFRHDYGTNDNGSTISWTWESPHLMLSDMGSWKWLDNLFVFAKKQTSGTITIEIYLDQSTTATYTITVDQTSDLLQAGLPIPIRGRAKSVKFKFINNEIDVPVEIHGLRIEAADLGSQT